MSSPVSWGVLGPAALLSSPALYDALVTGSMPLQTALVRFLVSAAVVWVGLSLLSTLLAATSPPPSEQETAAALTLAGEDGPLPVRPAKLGTSEPPARD